MTLSQPALAEYSPVLRLQTMSRLIRRKERLRRVIDRHKCAWQASQIFAVQKQKIKRVEHRLAPASQQRVELATTLVIQTNDLAVDHGILYSQTSQGFAKRTKAFVDVILPRDQLTAPISDVSDSAKTIMLQLENPIRMIEWSGDTRGNGKVDGWEMLHTLIVGGCTGFAQTKSRKSAVCQPNQLALQFRQSMRRLCDEVVPA